ncbi:hypothetical protein [Lagierella massiliensis]|uniref:hypothetical protein n=1 Tax=Lagierella massiliensis TaxID=1689303 RepID=UPI0006D7B3E5|nr:hypothetical protein [Lagierella massiliensis]
MRIDELRDEIDKLGQKYNEEFLVEELENSDGDSYIKVYINYSWELYDVARIELDKRYAFSMIEEGFDGLPEELQKELFEILVEFVRTPVGEREEEEKKYQYRLKEKYLWLKNTSDKENYYLNIHLFKESGRGSVLLSSQGGTDLYKTEFTDEEIKEVVEKFDVDLNMFDKIEVEDD